MSAAFQDGEAGRSVPGIFRLRIGKKTSPGVGIASPLDHDIDPSVLTFRIHLLMAKRATNPVNDSGPPFEAEKRPVPNDRDQIQSGLRNRRPGRLQIARPGIDRRSVDR